VTAAVATVRSRLAALVPRRPGRTAARWRGLTELARRIASLCRREGLTEADVVALVLLDGPGAVKEARLRRTVSLVFAGETPPDARATATLAEALEQRFGESLGVENLAGPVARLLAHVSELVGAVLGFSCLYLVLGGLLEGQSERFPTLSPTLSILVFVAFLALLGLFEALHTSVTQLKLADLRALATTHPRACALHRRFYDDTGIARFLAGRQIVVVVTVFVVAGLSSFPAMEELPFTSVAIPGPIQVAVELGIPGALIVLWVAQLAPQFYATRRAVRLMNTRAAGWAFDLALGLESIGLAQPAYWLARGGARDRIPSSPAKRWEQDSEEIDGAGHVSIGHRWEFDTEEAHLQVVSTTAVRRDGYPAISDSSLILPRAAAQMQVSTELSAADESHLLPAPTECEEEDLPTGERRLRKTMVPAVGSFAAGDRARAVVEADYTIPVCRDAILVERPIRFVSWRLALSEWPRHLSAVRLRTYRVGADLGDLSPLGEELLLEPSTGEGGLPAISYVHSFPPPHTLFVFEWDLEWR